GETGDMNRKFNLDVSDSDKRSLEDEIVTILKHLIAESDCLLSTDEERRREYKPGRLRFMR
ncbi:MAG: hypothetical protein R6U98_25430, partial [Pirellulaceae bacterium]